MKKKEIPEIFSLLRDEELTRFGEYIRSPYFKVPERIIKLYGIVTERREDIKAGRLTRKEIAAGILKKSTTEASIRKLFSDLNREIENFLKIEYLSSNNLKGGLFLVRQLRGGGNTLKARQAANNLFKQAEKLPPGDERYALLSYLNSELIKAEDDSDFYQYSAALQDESDNLDAAYFTRKLLLFQLMYSKEKLNSFTGTKYRPEMIGEILEFINNNKNKFREQYPDIYLKYLMLKMLGSADEALILEYRELLDKSESILTIFQQSDFYSDLYNYLTLRITEGDHHFRRPLFDLYKLLDKRGLLCDKGKNRIHQYTYKQVIDTAIHLNEVKWAEYFAGKYSGAIDDVNRKNIVSLEYAKISSYSGNIKSAREYLAKVDYRDYIHYIDSKLFLLCIEYDCGNYDDAELIMDSALKYIKNNPDIPELFSANARRTIRLMKKLFRIKDKDSDGFELQKLNEEIDNEKGFIYARNWMKDKIAELKGR